MLPSDRDQKVIDALQASIPRLQSILHSAQLQHDDAAAALDALAQAVTLLRPPPPEPDRAVERLALALVRASKTRGEIAFLAGISEPRLAAIVAGEPATSKERAALGEVLPDWMPMFPGGNGGRS